jgi:hypothetical protein
VSTVLVTLAVFAALLIGLVLLRTASGNRFEIKNTDQPSATPGTPLPGEQAQQFGPMPEPRLTADNVANWLNNKNVDELKTLPGFISADQALEQMNALDVQTIPVVNENKKFVGVVDRSKLTASILTDLAAKLEHSE